MCTSKHWATENWPFFSGVGFVCLAYQSCENNRVCIASSLFQVVHHIWVLRPDGTQPCVLITMASGYGEHPWLAPQVGSFQYKWWQPWQSKHDLYWASFFYTHVKMVIDESHQVQCWAKMSLSFIPLERYMGISGNYEAMYRTAFIIPL